MSQLTDEQKYLLTHQYHNASNMQEIPFEDETFDAVIANYVLHHVPDRAKAFAEVRRVLKPGGRFYAAGMSRRDRYELNELLSKLKPDADIAPPADTFYLENGAEELAGWFSQVTLHRYHDELVVTEIAPLIAYVLSSNITGSLLTGEKLAQFSSYVEQEIATKGAFRITKDAGMFEAIRG